MNNNTKKCYNSFSCIISVLIIVFLLGSVTYDILVSKPETRRSINEIKVEVEEINKKMDAQATYYYVKDSANIDNIKKVVE